jgi:flagellar basal body P-ring protein FlgI
VHSLKRNYIQSGQKKQKENSAKKETLNNIVEHYNCSMVKAQEIYDILESNKLLKVFAEMTDKGGK